MSLVTNFCNVTQECLMIISGGSRSTEMQPTILAMPLAFMKFFSRATDPFQKNPGCATVYCNLLNALFTLAPVHTQEILFTSASLFNVIY